MPETKVELILNTGGKEERKELKNAPKTLGDLSRVAQEEFGEKTLGMVFVFKMQDDVVEKINSNDNEKRGLELKKYYHEYEVEIAIEPQEKKKNNEFDMKKITQSAITNGLNKRTIKIEDVDNLKKVTEGMEKQMGEQYKKIRYDNTVNNIYTVVTFLIIACISGFALHNYHSLNNQVLTNRNQELKNSLAELEAQYQDLTEQKEQNEKHLNIRLEEQGETIKKEIQSRVKKCDPENTLKDSMQKLNDQVSEKSKANVKWEAESKQAKKELTENLRSFKKLQSEHSAVKDELEKSKEERLLLLKSCSGGATVLVMVIVLLLFKRR